MIGSLGFQLSVPNSCTSFRNSQKIHSMAETTGTKCIAGPNMRVLVYNGEGAGGRCAHSLKDSLEKSLGSHGVEVSSFSCPQAGRISPIQ